MLILLYICIILQIKRSPRTLLIFVYLLRLDSYHVYIIVYNTHRITRIPYSTLSETDLSSIM